MRKNIRTARRGKRAGAIAQRRLPLDVPASHATVILRASELDDLIAQLDCANEALCDALGVVGNIMDHPTRITLKGINNARAALEAAASYLYVLRSQEIDEALRRSARKDPREADALERTEGDDLTKAREQRFLADLERGKYPALAAGSWPIKRLMTWMEDGGMLFPDVVAMLVYNAAAECFRRDPDNTERFIREHFDLVLADLRDNGPEEEEAS